MLSLTKPPQNSQSWWSFLARKMWFFAHLWNLSGHQSSEGEATAYTHRDVPAHQHPCWGITSKNERTVRSDRCSVLGCSAATPSTGANWDLDWNSGHQWWYLGQTGSSKSKRRQYMYYLFPEHNTLVVRNACREIKQRSCTFYSNGQKWTFEH